MISIKEITDSGEKIEKAKEFGASVTEFHRCFLAKENGKDTAFGAMTYSGGVFVETVIVNQIGEQVYNLLVRAMMHVLRDMKNIRIYTKLDHFAFAELGFKRRGDVWEIMSDDLNFSCGSCKKD